MKQCPICGALVEVYPDYIWCEDCEHGWELEDFYEEDEGDDEDANYGDIVYFGLDD